MFTANMNGARLAFVVRELQGTVRREKYVMKLVKKANPNGKTRDQYEMKSEMVEEPAGQTLVADKVARQKTARRRRPCCRMRLRRWR